MADIGGKTWNEVKGGVTKGIDDFFNQELRNGSLGTGDAVVIDIAEAIMGMNIAGHCRFNDRMYTLMNRLMQININEKNIRFYSMGNNAHDFGSSDIPDSEIPRYRYTDGLNYLDTSDSLRIEEHRNQSSTQRYDNSYHMGQMYPNDFDYGNLYPDDIRGRLSGKAAEKKWQTPNQDSILSKTRRLFYQGKVNTIISRFGTAADAPSNNLNYKGRKDTRYGESHGRNLLTASSEKTGVSQYTFNGYNNPYCRVWTHHYQYDKYFKAIRPFNYIDSNGNYASSSGVRRFHQWDGFEFDRRDRKNNDKGFGYGWKNGDAGWEKSVLDTESKGGDGIVKIAPKYINGGRSNIHTKDCMFSIENLAWRGYDPYSFEKALSWEQRGPLGGRIMWFPPYGITFNETTNVNWSSSTFIGRGEDVFTYVNTQRSGTLSFLMVVDHPSVIDYASWHDEPGNVEDTDMLRFFAGCDSLNPDDPNSIMSIVKPTPLTDEYVNEYQEPVYDYPIVNTPPEKPTDPVKKVINVCFSVYYPNNYSGWSDSSADYTIGYLLSGKGAGKTNKGLDDIPYSFKALKSDGDGYGLGYEMNSFGDGAENGIGVDGISERSNETEINEFVSELDGDGNYIYAFAESYAKIQKRADKDRNKWFYRVDGKYSTEKSDVENTYGQRPLSPGGKRDTSVFGKNGKVYDTNYLDLCSYGYNSNMGRGFEETDDGADVYCSLTEIAYAIADIKDYGQTKGYLSDKHASREIEYNGEKMSVITLLETLLKDYELTEIKAVGFSNVHGDNKAPINEKRNNALAENRAKTVVNWLSGEGYSVEKPNIDYSGGKDYYENADNVKEKVERHQHSGSVAKFLRSADVVLTFSYSNTEELAAYDEKMATFQKYDKYSEAGTDAQGHKLYKHVDDGSIWFELSDGTLVRNDVGEEIGISAMRGRSQSQYWGKLEGGGYGWDDSTASGKRYYTDSAIQKKYSNLGDTSLDMALGGGERNRLRYDQEYYFFRTLEKKDPLVFNKLMDKIKYFDPAFHSMTPEGFNARLTFLNQCTRQGNTISMSDINGQTANNLAFGRPPFCVLRIGDFYNQMIVIDNINIDYSVSDGIQWDMNTEGIGMQPLLAQINISFKFIGGGDMAGPIRRLQNAMTFNYYANSRYYDNRADRVVYASENNYKVIGGAGNHGIDTTNSGNYAYITQTYKKNRQFTDDELKDKSKTKQT